MGVSGRGYAGTLRLVNTAGNFSFPVFCKMNFPQIFSTTDKPWFPRRGVMHRIPF